MLKTKSVHTAKSQADGLRVLVTRFRGRGLASDLYDVWMPNLGPSEELLRSFQSGEITWAELARRYRAELREDGAIDARNRTIKNHGQKFTLRLLKELASRGDATLMCHCAEDQAQCHRHLLAAEISKA